VLLNVLVVAACGRLAFDPRSDATPSSRDGSVDSAIDPDLVVHFPLEGVLESDLASGLSATCAGSGCPVPTPGIAGMALAFDGANDCVRVNDNAVLRPPTFTISVWARHDITRNDSLIAKLVGSVALEGNSFQFEVGDGGVWPADAAVFSTGTGTNEFLVQSDAPPAQGQWHHYAGTFDGTTKRLYVDGSLRDTAVGTVAYDGGVLTIGCDTNSIDQQYWDGDIDDVRIYRRALSAEEIADLATP